MTRLDLQLRDAGDPRGRPFEVRLRQALKTLLRSYGLRASWKPAPTPPPATTNDRKQGSARITAGLLARTNGGLLETLGKTSRKRKAGEFENKAA